MFSQGIIKCWRIADGKLSEHLCVGEILWMISLWLQICTFSVFWWNRKCISILPSPVWTSVSWDSIYSSTNQINDTSKSNSIWNPLLISPENFGIKYYTRNHPIHRKSIEIHSHIASKKKIIANLRKIKECQISTQFIMLYIYTMFICVV